MKADIGRAQTLSDLIDNAPVRSAQYMLGALVLLALILDGLDVQLLAFAAPIILADWSIDRDSFAPALAAAVVGMAFGAGLGGAMGDRWGRKPVLVVSTLGFGLATAATGLTENVTSMTLLRLVSGFGFGAATPNGIALVTEWLPHRIRPRIVSVLAIAAPLGGMVGAGGSMIALPIFGWEGAFAACGALTLVIGLLMVKFLPESGAYLLAKGKTQAAEEQTRRMIAAPFERLEPAAPSAAKAGKGETIFTRALARLNVGATLTFFTVMFVTYGMSSWMPTVLTTAGMELAHGLQSSLYFNTLAIGGALLIAAVIARTGSRLPLVVSLVLGLAALVTVLMLMQSPVLATDPLVRNTVLILIGVVGGASGASTTCLYAISASAYPVERRSTGIGFTVMAGRIGGMVTILVSGKLLTIGGAAAVPFFTALIGSLALALVGVFVIDRHIPALARN